MLAINLQEPDAPVGVPLPIPPLSPLFPLPPAPVGALMIVPFGAEVDTETEVDVEVTTAPDSSVVVCTVMTVEDDADADLVPVEVANPDDEELEELATGQVKLKRGVVLRVVPTTPNWGWCSVSVLASTRVYQ